MQRDVFGAEGDFITSPEISQMFGEVRSILWGQKIHHAPPACAQSNSAAAPWCSLTRLFPLCADGGNLGAAHLDADGAAAAGQSGGARPGERHADGGPYQRSVW